MTLIITVDGPSGAGKGTLCQLLANATGYPLLDSGALYRLTALAALQGAVDFEDEETLATVAAQLDIAFDTNAKQVRVLLQGNDVSKDIRQEYIGMAASQVAARPLVRAALLARQRAFAKGAGLVADGRDMGTVVFPNAPVKLFLTASAQERANRRVLQLQAAGQSVFYETILADIQARDKQDMERVSAPLVPAIDALKLDSTHLTIEQVFDLAMQAVRAAQLQ